MNCNDYQLRQLLNLIRRLSDGIMRMDDVSTEEWYNVTSYDASFVAQLKHSIIKLS